MKKLGLLFLVVAQSSFAQVNIGVKNDIFISTNAITSNPSVFLQNPNPWEVNVFSADVFFQNNYSFIAQQSLLGLTNKDVKLYSNSSSNQDNLPKNTVGYEDNRKFNEYVQTDVLGPAFAMKFKIKDQEFAAGFYTRLRTLGSGLGIDNQYKFVNFVNQTSFSRYYSPFELSYATIQENAVFVSKPLIQNRTTELLAGLTVKQANVWDAFIVRNNNTFQLDYDRSTNNLTLANYNFDVFASTSYDFANKKYTPKSNGKSYGADIGFTYVDYGDYEKENGEYLQKIGFSITDIGFVKINGEYHNFMSNPFVINKKHRFSNTDNVFNLLREISTIVYDNPDSSLEDTSLSVALPTVLHLSYSGNLTNNRYLTLGLTQRIPLSKNAFKTANVLYANYAKNKSNFTYAAQVSVFEYNKLQVGGYLRWGPFFMGSDNVLPIFFSQKKLDSFDFYLGLKIYPFWSDAMSRRNNKACNCN